MWLQRDPNVTFVICYSQLEKLKWICFIQILITKLWEKLGRLHPNFTFTVFTNNGKTRRIKYVPN